jgi:hypothetical protein
MASCLGDVVLKQLIAALLFALASSGAWATDANHLLSDCERTLTSQIDPRSGVAMGYCLGFLAAVLEMQAPHLCPPASAEGVQAISVFVHYARTHPRHELASAVVLDAFRDAWPCPKGVETTQ